MKIAVGILLGKGEDAQARSLSPGISKLYPIQSCASEFSLLQQQLVREDEWLWQQNSQVGKAGDFWAFLEGRAISAVLELQFGALGEQLGWEDLGQVGPGRCDGSRNAGIGLGISTESLGLEKFIRIIRVGKVH